MTKFFQFFVRNDSNIKGICTDEEEYKLTQNADDTGSEKHNDFTQLLLRYFWCKNQLHQV